MEHFCRMFDFKQLIDKPTRVTPTSKTALDLIFVSDQQNVSQSGVLTYGVSDHFLTFCSRKTTKLVFNKHKTIKVRSMKNYSTVKFQDLLKNLNWSQVLICDNVE